MQSALRGMAVLLCLISRLAVATPVAGVRGMVATAHPEASAGALAMLDAGGTACDAAVAAAFVLAVVEPYSSTLGGGGLALVRHQAKVTFLDFREVAPGQARADMFMHGGVADTAAARDGPLAVAVPGAVAGYVALHRRCGALPLERVLGPAIRLASQGFTVDLKYNGLAKQRLQVLRQDAEATRIFLRPGDDGGAQPAVGTRIVQADLARTLHGIASDAGESFYHGPLAAALARGVQARGGILTAADLAAYQVRERPPLLGSFRGMAVVTAPLPSAGGHILLTLLNALETQPPSTPWHDLAGLRLFVEAAKVAYADRTLLGDPSSVPDAAHLSTLLLAKRRATVIAARAAAGITPATQVAPGSGSAVEKGAPPADAPHGGPETTHISVCDAAGNAVALTTTLNYAWGSGIVSPGTGVLFNDEMDDFAVAVGSSNAYGMVGSAANGIGPGKTPLSNMTPTLVFAGSTPASPLRLVVGSPGGGRIPTTVAQVIVNYLDHDADLRTAVSLGRVHHQHTPDVVQFEAFALDPATVRALRELGYVTDAQKHWCNAMAIGLDPATGLRTAAADPRGIGVALAQ